jgi:hypothetical protein
VLEITDSMGDSPIHLNHKNAPPIFEELKQEIILSQKNMIGSPNT